MCTGAPTGTPGSIPARRPSRVRLPPRPRRARGSGWTWMARRVPSAPRRSCRPRVPTRTGVPRARASGRTRGGVGADGWPGARGACRRRVRAGCPGRVEGHTSTSVRNAPGAGRTQHRAPGRCGRRTPSARPAATLAGPKRPASCHRSPLAFAGGAGAGSSGRWRRRACCSEAGSCWCRSCCGSPRRRLAASPPRPGRVSTRDAASRLSGSHRHSIKARSALPQPVHEAARPSRRGPATALRISVAVGPTTPGWPRHDHRGS